MKLEFVLPLLGETGGAERTLAALGRHITATSDWEVTVQTTCASSATEWENDLEPGVACLDGLTFHRHLVDSGRTAVWPRLESAINRSPRTINGVLARAYLLAQGPISISLAQALADSDADLALHMPYPYWTTVALADRRPKPTVIWPAAHDEPGLKLLTIRESLCGVDALVFGSESERRLTQETHPIAHKRQLVLGVGVDEHPGDADRAAAAVGIDDGRPWIVCVGRMLPGKGTQVLAEMWTNYVRRNRPDHRLVFAGEPSVDIHTDDHTLVAGSVDEYTKWGLIRGADVLIHPGRLESFGIVLMEAWASHTPVLVNAHCGPTADHVAASGGGATFRNTAEFQTELSAMLNDTELRHTRGAAGNQYWQTKYTWDHITPRFMKFCERLIHLSPKTHTKP